MLSCMSKVSLPWDDVDITLHNVFSRQSSMQLNGDNTTISVKVTKKLKTVKVKKHLPNSKMLI